MASRLKVVGPRGLTRRTRSKFHRIFLLAGLEVIGHVCVSSQKLAALFCKLLTHR